MFFGSPVVPRAAMLAVLAIIADHEGMHFDARVEDCRITADNGQTVSSFGLMRGASWAGHSRDELCHGGTLPPTLALRAFAGYAKRCSRASWIGVFRGYASGSCAVKSDAATRLCNRWARVAGKLGLVGAHCEGPRREIR